MTEDNIVRGPGTNNFLGLPPMQIEQPTSVFTIVVRIKEGEYKGLWKYSSYVDAKNLWTNSPRFDDYVNVYRYRCEDGALPAMAESFCQSPTCNEDNKFGLSACVNRDFKLIQVPNEYELYNLTDDPFEVKNLQGDRPLEFLFNQLLKMVYKQVALQPLVGNLQGTVTSSQL